MPLLCSSSSSGGAGMEGVCGSAPSRSWSRCCSRRRGPNGRSRQRERLRGVNVTAATFVAVVGQVVPGVVVERELGELLAVFRHAENDQWVPRADFEALGIPTLRVGPIKADEDRWLEQALRRKTGHADTHPSLSDRLAAPGVSASREPAVGAGGSRLLAAAPRGVPHGPGSDSPRSRLRPLGSHSRPLRCAQADPDEHDLTAAESDTPKRDQAPSPKPCRIVAVSTTVANSPCRSASATLCSSSAP